MFYYSFVLCVCPQTRNAMCRRSGSSSRQRCVWRRGGLQRQDRRWVQRATGTLILFLIGNNIHSFKLINIEGDFSWALFRPVSQIQSDIYLFLNHWLSFTEWLTPCCWDSLVKGSCRERQEHAVNCPQTIPPVDKIAWLSADFPLERSLL